MNDIVERLRHWVGARYVTFDARADFAAAADEIERLRAKGPAPAAEPQLPPPATQSPAEIMEAVAKTLCFESSGEAREHTDDVDAIWQHQTTEQNYWLDCARAAITAYQKATVAEPRGVSKPQLPPPQGREKEELSDSALRIATQPPAENSTALPWPLEIWVIYQSGRPFDYRFSRAAGYQRLKELRAEVPSGEWDLNNCDARLVMQEVTGADTRGVSEPRHTQGRESVLGEASRIAERVLTEWKASPDMIEEVCAEILHSTVSPTESRGGLEVARDYPPHPSRPAMKER